MSVSRRPLLESVFLLTEGLAWFIVLRALGTAAQRARLSDLEQGVRLLADEADLSQRTALQALSAAADDGSGGPSLVAVLVAAFGAFLLMRWIVQSGLPNTLAAVLGLAVSVIALHLLLVYAITGDLAFWAQSSFGGVLGDEGIRERVTAEEYLASGDPGVVGNASVALTAAGLSLLWVRFLLAGRRAISFEGALLSYSIGFAAVLIAVMVNEASGGSGSGFALVYFVLGALTLAVAHAARAHTDEALARTAPWAASVGATLGLMAGVALLFGLLATLDVQRLFAFVAAGVGDLVGWLLLMVLTPVFAFGQWLASLVGVDANDVSFEIGEQEPAETEEGDETTTIVFPGWTLDVLRALALAAVGWLLYRLSKMVFRRLSRSDEAEYAEVRSEGADGGDTGMGALLRRLVPRGRGRGAAGWIAKHQAYRLFARTVVDAEERGRPRQRGETAIEAANAAGTALSATQPFVPIAAAFDLVRYGRRDPDADELRRLDRELTVWEERHPVDRSALPPEPPEPDTDAGDDVPPDAAGDVARSGGDAYAEEQ